MAVRDCQVEMVALQDATLAEAMGELDPVRKADIARTLRYVWFSTLLGWVNGWNDYEAIEREFEAAARLLLGSLP